MTLTRRGFLGGVAAALLVPRLPKVEAAPPQPIPEVEIPVHRFTAFSKPKPMDWTMLVYGMGINGMCVKRTPPRIRAALLGAPPRHQRPSQRAKVYARTLEDFIEASKPLPIKIIPTW